MPLPRLPEVALAGRSNSGKSSLINFLCGHHSAKMKKVPGSTTEIVFWKIGRPTQLCLVDLPGYGFAYTPRETRLQWTEFTLWYLRSRKNLMLVLLLVDARWSLKPADKEMIAFFERHNVKWQIVLSKCDKVQPKELARRLTLLLEELKDYYRMAGDPIPVSALRRMGMEKLRHVLNKFKVAKELVKEGIRERVYDLLEMKRIRRSERARKKRQAKRLEQEEKLAAEKTASEKTSDNAETDSESEADAGFQTINLHTVLDENRSGNTKEEEMKPASVDLSYTLDDRDSKRIDGFMGLLFPDLRAPSNDLSTSAVLDGRSEDVVGNPDMIMPTGVTSWYSSTDSSIIGLSNSDDDSESDDETMFPKKPLNVLHFESAPVRLQAGLGSTTFNTTPPPLPSPSPFPSLPVGGSPQSKVAGHPAFVPVGGEPPSPRQKVNLLEGAPRPPSFMDQIYEHDDFASPEDRAAGLRRNSPRAPSSASTGEMIAQARQRYEREWAMELENIEHSRVSTDGTLVTKPEPSEKSEAEREAKRQQKLARRLEATQRSSYIGLRGSEPVPKGKRRSKLMGRAPSRILKKKRIPDASIMLGFKARKEKKRQNFGSDMSWADAKKKWLSWYEHNRKRRFHRVMQSGSPNREDIEEAFDEQQQFRRSPRTRRQHKSEDE